LPIRQIHVNLVRNTEKTYKAKLSNKDKHGHRYLKNQKGYNS